MGAADDARPAGGSQRETLADLGEWELIRRLGAFAPRDQFSDDAALLSDPSDPAGALVVNTDVLVEGIHFSDATTGAGDVGWRAAAANLSDLAAMGATEVVGITVALVAPSGTAWNWVEGVYGGLRQALDRYGGVLLGGDCSSGNQRLLAITAIGRIAPPAGPIRRGDGRPGDLLVCTGAHGLSRLGLALLQGDPLGTIAPHPAPTSDSALGKRAIQAHRRPVPRFDAVRRLIATRPTLGPWRVAGCDSSDGLAAAVAAIAQASGCQALLERRSLPLDPAMASQPEAMAWCLEGGEDFELVLALEPGWAEALVAALPGTTRIGELVAGDPGALGWTDGAPWGPGKAAAAGGYSHFRGDADRRARQTSR
jgi:thiamine-monophosphate kinase